MRRNRMSLAILLLIAVAIAFSWRWLRERSQHENSAGDTITSVSTAGGNYFFCFWNVENLFDDQEDLSLDGVDRQIDRWFANNPHVLEQKLARLSDALLQMNDGAGPDILALAEVEGFRAADLLRHALNERISDSQRHYRHIVLKDTQGLRHISPAVISRLPIDARSARVLGRKQRILECRITIDGKELVVVTCHWTSRKSDANGDARGRYADQVYGAYRAMWQRNPQLDYLVCGDFNDTPQDVSVTRHLRATGDPSAVRQSRGEPLLLNLMAERDPERFGTYYFERLVIIDQIAVSPGMLDDDGWSCDPASLQVVNSLARPNDRRRRPWSFGSEGRKDPRGYSDHFPVTAQLQFNQRKS